MEDEVLSMLMRIERKIDALIEALAEDVDDETVTDLDGKTVSAQRDQNQAL